MILWNYFLHYIIDINECDTDNGGCEQICINTVRLFNCSCQSGFRLVNNIFCSGNIVQRYLISTLMSFIDIDECSEGISGCSQICSNTIGSYSCICQNGYQLGSDDHTCLGKIINAL